MVAVIRSTGVFRFPMMSMTSTAEHVTNALSSDSTGPGACLAPASIRCVRPAGPASNGQLLTYQFLKTGRYLVICMNRVHFLNDWMFGFVNVVGEEEK